MANSLSDFSTVSDLPPSLADEICVGEVLANSF